MEMEEGDEKNKETYVELLEMCTPLEG